MNAYQNTERRVEVLAEARKEANKLSLLIQLERLVEKLAFRQPIKGFKKIKPLTANTYEARLSKKYRAYIVFDRETPVIFKVGEHL